MPKKQYQHIQLELSDGSKHFFCGLAATQPGDTRTITGIKFTEPKDLPEGVNFEPITDKTYKVFSEPA